MSWLGALTVLLVLTPALLDGWRMRRAERFMRDHRIEAIQHVHDGGDMQVIAPKLPTKRQLDAWKAFADTLEDDHDE
jgi:hypothetical protein